MILKLLVKATLILLFLVSCSLSYAQILQGSTTVNAGANMTVTVTVNTINNTVDLTLTGPSSQWFGFGFGGSTMFNRYAIITLGSGTVEERKLGNHAAGTALSSSFSSSNTSVLGGVRTVNITRPIVGPNSNYYSFPTTATSIPIIWARGSSSSLSQHNAGNRGPSMIVLSDICNIPPTVLTPLNACSGDSSLIFGKFRTVAGIYKDTLSSALGCDSVIEQELIFYPSGTFTQPAVTICEGDSMLVLGQYRKTAGVYTLSLTSSNGCDSIATQEVIVNTVDTSVVNMGDTLQANVSGAQYQWYDCTTGFAVPNETSRTLTSFTGIYRVEITQNGCTESSGCHSIDNSSSLNENSLQGVEIYPNPVTNILNLELEPQWINAALRILNTSGEVVRSTRIDAKTQSLNLADLPAGIYYILLEDKHTAGGKKFIKY